MRALALLFAMLMLWPLAAQAAAAEPRGGPAPRTLTDALREWASKLPQTYGRDGGRMPLDGTPFFETVSQDELKALMAPEGRSRAFSLKYSGTRSDIYVDSAASPYPSNADLQNLSNEFDTKIWPNVTTSLGSPPYAKINIYIYYMDGAYNLGGYFTSATPSSLYIDSADMNTWGYQILAHEFQHLIHYSKDWDEDTWVNEGCSDYAIEVVYGPSASGLTDHIYSFERVPDNDLTLFNNSGEDYGSSYAFMKYLADHYGGSGIVKDIIAYSGNGIAGISAVLSARGVAKSFTDIFYDFAVANYVDNMTINGGIYGYKNLTIEIASEATHTVYSASRAGSVRNWATDVSRFDPLASSEKDRLIVNFTAGAGVMKVALAKETASGPTVDIVTLDAGRKATVTVDNMGLTVKRAALVVAASAAGAYSYTADLLDLTPPRTTLYLNPMVPDGMDGWYVTAPRITLVSTDVTATSYYSWDGAVAARYTGVLTAPEGVHTITFYGVDPFGNTEAVQSRTIRVDTALPVSNLTVAPAAPNGENGWYTATPSITINASEAGTILYRLGSATEANATAPFTFQPAAGVTTVYYRARDIAGNLEAARSYSIKVDLRTPASTLHIDPAAPSASGWYTTAPAISFTVNESADANGTPSVPARLLYGWDNGTATAELAASLAVPEGTHTLYYRAVDSAGRAEELRSFDVKVDTVVPVSNITVTPPAPDGTGAWYRSRPVVNLSLVGPAGGETIMFRWDDENVSAYAAPLAVPDGRHTLYYRAVDPAGNTETERRVSFMVDTTAPGVNGALSPPLAGGAWYRANPVLRLNTTEENAAIYYRTSDGGSENFYLDPVEVTEGKRTYSFWAVDEAGNRGDTRNISVMVDTRAPFAAIDISSTAPYADDAVTVNLTRSKDNIGIVKYRLNFGDGEVAPWGNTTSFNHKYRDAGRFTLSVEVVDAAGWNATATAEVEVKKKTSPTTVQPGPVIPGTGDGGDTEKPITFQGRDLPCTPTYLILGTLVIVALVGAGAYYGVSSRARRRERERMLAVKEELEFRQRPPARPRPEQSPPAPARQVRTVPSPARPKPPPPPPAEEAVEVMWEEPQAVQAPPSPPSRPPQPPAAPPVHQAQVAPRKQPAPTPQAPVAQYPRPPVPVAATPPSLPAAPPSPPPPPPQPEKRGELDSQIASILSKLGK